MNDPSEEPTIDLRIADVLQAWLERREGEVPAPSADELIEAHPELAPHLANCLAGLERIDAGSSGFWLDDEKTGSRSPPLSTCPEIPDFEILGELGRGGMGVVYEAKQQSLDRIVALKVLPIGTMDPRAIERFTREAETAATLHHTNIVPIHAVGRSEGLYWYAMQRIEGESLARGLSEGRGPMPVADVIRIGIDAAEALSHAHARGVIHRDVKPGNLLIDPQQRVWLTDFGLARREMDVTATVTGAVMGTPRYMSPEQVRGAAGVVDHRSDIYSLGATLYELATGRPVFDADGPLELLAKIQRDDPAAPRSLRSSLPRELELVLLKCLDKDPTRRYESAATLSSDLRAIRDDRPIIARGLPWWVKGARHWKRHEQQARWIAAAVLSTVGTLVAFLLLWQQHQAASLGSLQIGAARGPYVASIAPVDQETPESGGMHVTAPMQQPEPLRAGEYRVRLDGRGRFSESGRVNVVAERSTEMRYVDRRPEPPTVDIAGKLAFPVGTSSLAVLDDEALSLYDAEGQRRYRLLLAEVADHLVDPMHELTSTPMAFGFDADAGNTGDWHVPRSLFARPSRIIPVGDDRLLLAAANRTALVAMNGDGQIQWRKAYELPLDETLPAASPHFGMPIQRFIDIVVGGDLNDDGTKDFATTAVHIDALGMVQSFVMTIDGAQGTLLSATPLPTVDAKKQKSWPDSGKLLWQRGLQNDHRPTSHLMPTGYGGFGRSYPEWPADLQWTGGGPPSRLPVPTPIRQIDVGGRATAVVAMNRELVSVDLNSGALAEPGVRLPADLLDEPSVVRLNREGAIGLLVFTDAPPVSGEKSIRASVYRAGAPTPLWSKAISGAWNVRHASMSKSDLPLMVDLDGDGADEIVFAEAANGWRDMPRLLCLDAATGESRWSNKPAIIGIARTPERCAVVQDIDGDGIRDLAVTGVALLRAEDRSATDGMSVYVDVVSGRDGRLIGWRSEPFPGVSGRPSVAEVDAAVYVEEENALEVSFVYGQLVEAELASAVIRFDLGDQRGTSTARGLTAMHTESAGPAGYYRRRRGPDGIEPEAAVWLDRQPADYWFGAQNVLALYEANGDRDESSTRMLLADASSIFAVEASTNRTLWRREDLSNRRGRAVSLPREDGEVDLLVQQSAFQPADAIVLNGDNGRTRFALDDFTTGEFIDVQISDRRPGRWFYVTAYSQYNTFGPRNMSQAGYWLMKIDRQSKVVVWRRPVSVDLRNSLHVERPPALIEMDVTSDEIPDLVCGDYSDSKITIKAFDGVDGNLRWSQRLRQPFAEDLFGRTWPLYQRVSAGNQERLLVLDIRSDQQTFAVRMLDPRTGMDVAEMEIPGDVSSLAHHARQEGFLSLTVVSESGGQTVVGAVVPRRVPGEGTCPVWTAFEVTDNSLSRLHEQTCEPLMRIIVTDVDDDGVCERIAYKDRRAECREPLSDEIRWKVEMDDHWRFAERAGDATEHWLMAVGEQFDGFQWLDLRNGELAYSLSRRHALYHHGKHRFPALIPAGKQIRAIGQTQEGIYTVPLQTPGSVPDATTAVASALHPSDADPRRVARLPILAEPVDRRIGQVVRAMSLAVLGLILPLAYIYRPLRRRRWSLAWLMFAPAVALIAMFAWRWLLVATNNGVPVLNQALISLFGGTMACVGLAGLVHLVAAKQWKAVAATCVVSVFGTALIVVAAYAQNSFAQLDLRFQVSITQVMVLYSGVLINVAVVMYAAFLIGKRFQHATKNHPV